MTPGSWPRWIFLPAVVLAVAVAAGVWLLRSPGKPQHTSAEAIPSMILASPSPKWSQAVERARHAIRAGLAGQNVPGVSVAVGAESEIVWAEGFGWADIETHSPVSPDTRFRIGTASAALTSAAVGKLAEKGQLSLDEEIQTHVPQFPKKQWPVTLRQLMAQVAGVGIKDEDDGPLFRRRCEQPVEALPDIAPGALLFEPGSRYRYSTYGWSLVSAAVEAAAHQPFLNFMREQIFEPLSMDHTGAESATKENPEKIGGPEEDPPFMTAFRQMILKPLGVVDPAPWPATDPATLYASGHGPNLVPGWGLHVMRLGNLSCYAGSMAFFSSPSDLVRFGLAINGGTLLRPDTVRSLQTSHTLASGQPAGHGLGWDVGTVTLADRSTAVAGNDGNLRGQTVASFRIYRETGLVVAVMSNGPYADVPSLALKIAEGFAQSARR